VAEFADCADLAFDVAELATTRVENLLVVRELAVVAKARWLLVSEVAKVIESSLSVPGAGTLTDCTVAATCRIAIYPRTANILPAPSLPHKLPREWLVLCYSDSQQQV
jgi:hypothetical protein